MSSSALEVTDLRVRYGGAIAVKGVSLSLEPGATCAIVGPNGAGKTSLLLGIQGIVKASVAALRLRGETIERLSPLQRERAGMVLVPQGRQIFPTLSVRSNLQVIADALRLPSSAVDAALDRFPILRQRASRPAGVLSGGEQKILAIARALMSSPSVLLLDEPTEGLAPTIVSTVTETLEQIQHDGGTILITEPTTRVLPEHVSLGFVMMRGGVIAQAHTREELRKVFLEHYGR